VAANRQSSDNTSIGQNHRNFNPRWKNNFRRVLASKARLTSTAGGEWRRLKAWGERFKNVWLAWTHLDLTTNQTNLRSHQPDITSARSRIG
jgi:hypothetical protein